MSDLLAAVVAWLTGLLTGGFLTALLPVPAACWPAMSFEQREQLYRQGR
jgi:hypothetical protein